MLVYRSGKDREEIVRSAQNEINRVGEWCDSHNGKLHPDKACVLWCSLNNRAVKTDMPTVNIQGKTLSREHSLKYLGITFDRSLSFNLHITHVINRARKGLVAVKTMAAAKMPQHVLLILYKALVLSVIDYGLGLLTLSATQLQRLEVLQNEGMRSILGCTRDTSTEAMRYVLDLPPMQDRHKISQVKAYLRVAADTSNPLHDKIGRNAKCRLKRGSEWLTQAAKTIDSCTSVQNVRRGEAWKAVEDPTEQFTTVISTLGRECREWAPGAAHAEVETLIEENSRVGDLIVFTDGSVTRNKKSGWAFSARLNGKVIAENSSATDLTLSSMATEVNAITLALTWIAEQPYERLVIVTDSLSTLEKVRRKSLHADWTPLIQRSSLTKITWIYCPGHAGVSGNEAADKLAGDAQIETNQVLYDPQAVIKIVESSISDSRDDSTSSSHTLLSLIESGVMRGDGVKSKLRGPTRRRTNQLLMNTVSAQTLKWSLGWRTEQLWGCPTCRDVNS